MARILVIDDDAPLRSVIAETLVVLGHQVVQAEDGRQGVELFHAAPADLVITDLIMPGQEGIETIAQLHKEFPALPIIAISGGMSHTGLFLEMAKRLGARQTLAKPFSTADLQQAIARVLPSTSPPAAHESPPPRG